jgi:hypothetical protein
MAEIGIPFVEEDVDTSEGASSTLMTVGMVILGFAIFAWAQGVGNYVAQIVNSNLASVLGFDPTTGEDSSDGGVPGV